MRDHRNRGFRPPWWPEDEPFPPTGPARWGTGRRFFLRRVALILGVLFGLAFLATALGGALLWHTLGPGPHRGLVFPVGLGALAMLVLVFAAVTRAVRRTTRPLSDVMEAADRVAAGDYRVRVQERGPGDVRSLARSFNEMTDRLRASEEMRRNLLADLAHELRTPLSVIQGNVEGMLDGLYPADGAHLEPVLEVTKVMSRLLEDLQTLSTAEAGVLRLHREAVEPRQLVEDAVAAFRSQADAAGVSLEARVSDGLPVLDVDPVRIGEVLSNLASNALRHTPRGGSVTISAAPADDAGAVAVAFAVRDTGPGIAPQALPLMFDRFVKEPNSGGAGLGLAIARSLVEAHGGTIRADSTPGHGTRMQFVLPA